MTKKEIAIHFLQLVVANQVSETFSKYTSPNLIHHNPHTPGTPQALADGMGGAALQFPDTTLEIQRSLEDGNLVAVHSRLHLKPNGPEMAVVHIFRFEGDRIAELWDIGQPILPTSVNENGMF